MPKRAGEGESPVQTASPKITLELPAEISDYLSEKVERDGLFPLQKTHLTE